MRFRKNFLLIFLFILVFIPINLTQSLTQVESDGTTVIIQITDAYYFAADKDDLENDVATEFTLDVFSRAKNSVNFYLLVRLTLPSGIDYEYLYKVFSPCKASASPIVYFYNHATEEGWYCVEITAILAKGNQISGIGTETVFFDPPGGTGGTDPLACKITI